MSVAVCVGRVGRPHGVRGEISVEVRTDEPENRFLVGTHLRVEGKHPGLPAVLTLTGVRRHQAKNGERLLLTCPESPDRDAAEALRGALLYVDLPDDAAPADEEEFYDHQLVGLAVEDEDGERLGVVTDVLHHGAQDLLVVDAGEHGREVLVPFVGELVPVVDVPGGRLVVADRPGLVRGAPEEARE